MKIGDWVVPNPGSPQFWRHNSMFYVCIDVKREGDINEGNVTLLSLDKQECLGVLAQHVGEYAIVRSDP